MKVKIGFTGDFCPWLRMEEHVKNNSWKPLLETVQPFFAENDFNIIDMEAPLTIPLNPIPKTGPHIHASPESAEILNYLNTKLVVTANNHMMDYGVSGLDSTFSALKKYGINWVGSGQNLSEAIKPFVFELNGMSFGIINATENEWTTTTGNKPGCAPLDPVLVFNAIQSIRSKVDFVIVVAHGGHEHYNLPSPRIKKLYRFFVDAGANAVIAHHTHIISGYEYYKDAPIYYSLGNFCFDWEGLRNGTWNKGMMLRLSFEKGKPIEDTRFFIQHMDDFVGVKLMPEADQILQQNQVDALNDIILNDEKLESSFEIFLKQKTRVFNTWIEPYQGKILAGLHVKGLIPSLMSKSKRRLLLNLTRCESHRDILLKALEE